MLEIAPGLEDDDMALFSSFFSFFGCFLAAKPYERHGVLLKILWDCLFSGGEEGGALDYHKGVVGTLSGYLLM